MYEVRDKNSGAILFKKSASEKKVDRLEEEVRALKSLLEQALQGNPPLKDNQN